MDKEIEKLRKKILLLVDMIDMLLMERQRFYKNMGEAYNKPRGKKK